MKIGDVVYYGRCLNETFDVYELKVRFVGETWFSAMDKKEPITFLFDNKEIGKCVFHDRHECLEYVKIMEGE